MHVPLFIHLSVTALTATAFALPQHRPNSTTNLLSSRPPRIGPDGPPSRLRCFPFEPPRFPRVIYEECEEIFLDFDKKPHYRERRSWDGEIMPKNLGYTSDCQIVLNKCLPDNRDELDHSEEFSWEDISDAAFNAINWCTLAPFPGAGGTLTVGASIYYEVIVRGLVVRTERNLGREVGEVIEEGRLRPEANGCFYGINGNRTIF